MRRRDFIALRIPPRWRRIVAYTGAKSVQAWITKCVEDCLELGPLRYVPVLPLHWRRDVFRVERRGGAGEPHTLSVNVEGWTAGPFGVYRKGLELAEPVPSDDFYLVHLPSGQAFVCLRRLKSCKKFAEEMSGLRLRLDLADTDKVALGRPDAKLVPPMIRRFELEEMSEPRRRQVLGC